MTSLTTEKLYPREKYLSRIRGFYHEGKPSIMKMIVRERAEQNIPESSILYFNLDKRPYVGMTRAEQLDELIEKYYNPDTVQYLFIDEVQNVKDYERVERKNVSSFMVKRENRKYTADEIIYEIKRCGNTEEEIYAVYDLIEKRFLLACQQETLA